MNDHNKTKAQLIEELRECRKKLAGSIPISSAGGTIADVELMKVALRECEMRFHSLFSNMIEGVALHELVFDESGQPVNYRLVNANERFESVIGLRRINVLGKLATQAYGIPEPPYLKEYSDVVLTGQPRVMEAYYPPMDKYFTIAITPWGKQGFATIFTDITGRKKAAEVLQESENRFRTIFEQAAIGVALLNTKTGQFIRVNQKYCDFVGYTMEEMLQKTFMDITHPQDIQTNGDRNAQLMEGTITSASFEKRYVRKDGTIVWGDLAISPLWKHGERPDIFYHIAIVQDITIRKQAEEALRESGESFRIIFENNSAAMCIIEANTTISMVNSEYCKISGYDKNEIIGLSWTRQIPPEDLERLMEYNRRRLVNPNDAPDKYEFSFYHKSGEIRHALMSVSLIQHKQKIIASFVDITERRQMEEKLRRSNTELQTALAEVKTLSGMLPICAGCKKIRDDKGYWNQIETYISHHTDATFTHGLCPECMKIYFPGNE